MTTATALSTEPQLDLPTGSFLSSSSLESFLSSLTHSLHLDSFLPTPTSQLFALLLTLLSLIFSLLLLHRLLFSPSSRATTVLLTGPLSSGKTLLFFQLLQGHPRPTQTSLIPNIATFTPSLTPSLPPFRYFDLPGHPSQSHLLPPLIPTVRGIILVLDDSSLSLPSFPSTASLLHSLLEREALQARRVGVLVWWNRRKGEEAGSVADGPKDIADLRRRLEEGVQRRQMLKEEGGGVGSMVDLGGETEGKGVRSVGKVGKEFALEDSLMPITVAEGNALKGELKAVTQWLSQL